MQAAPWWTKKEEKKQQAQKPSELFILVYFVFLLLLGLQQLDFTLQEGSTLQKIIIIALVKLILLFGTLFSHYATDEESFKIVHSGNQQYSMNVFYYALLLHPAFALLLL